MNRTDDSGAVIGTFENMKRVNRTHRRNAIVEAPAAPQSRSQPARLPLQENNFRIRNAKLTDAPELAALMRELGYQTTRDEMRMRLRSILSDARCSTFVGKIDNELCAMIGTLTHISHEHNDLSGKIIALVVSKQQRRIGIGRALIAAAEKDFARRNVTRVTLTTRFEREDAHRFYKALGYSRTGFRFGKKLTPDSQCE
jgi:ribosomal protein S18 acetylase RimI-like enzyme